MLKSIGIVAGIFAFGAAKVYYTSGEASPSDQVASTQSQDTSTMLDDAFDEASSEQTTASAATPALENESALDKIALLESVAMKVESPPPAQSQDDDIDCECAKNIKGKYIPFHAQVFVMLGKSEIEWESKFETSDPLLKRINSSLRALKKSNALKIRFNGVDKKATNTQNGVELLVFHSKAMIRVTNVTAKNCDEHFNRIFVEENFSSYEMLKGSHVFVCCHNNRDGGCGEMGNAVYKEFVSQTSHMSDATIYRCTCLLSHKYAGMVIIFQGPGKSKFSNEKHPIVGELYGKLSPSRVPQLIKENIINGTLVPKYWIGRMHMTPKLALPFLKHNKFVDDEGNM